VFTWRGNGTRYFASLHAWARPHAAIRTLERIVAGLLPVGRVGAGPGRLQPARLLD
jgi:hypothetical protein